MPVDVEIVVERFEDRAPFDVFLQRARQELRGCRNDEMAERFAGADEFRNLEQDCIGPQRLGLEAGEELAADVVIVRQVLVQEALQLVVGGLGDSEGVAGIAGPVDAFLDRHLADTGQQFVVGGVLRVHLAPLVGRTD